MYIAIVFLNICKQVLHALLSYKIPQAMSAPKKLHNKYVIEIAQMVKNPSKWGIPGFDPWIEKITWKRV